ncbi:MAG TPA: C39 family peptidase [Chloroflexia bacterium]|nr:C39 family peptidase [Chloroflexia bacterium]
MLWLNNSRFVLPQVEAATGPDSPSYLPESGYELAVVDCAGEPFTELVLSWNADTPAGTGLHTEVRVRYGPVDGPPESGTWSDWQPLGHWGREGAEGAHRPHSQLNGADHAAPLKVVIDVLQLDEGVEAAAFQLRLTLYGGAASPEVRLLAVSTAHRGRPTLDAAHDPPLGREIRLSVPARSQRVERPEIAGEICSPTSLSMVLQFYGIDEPTEQVAEAVYDHGAEIYGNWPFNVAYAGSHGLRAVVRHFRGMGEIERELHRGHPVIVSIAFQLGELPESPTQGTRGHLLVVTGVTAAGDFHVNEPDAHPAEGEPVERIYSREGLRRAFLGHSAIGYVIEPAGESLAAPAGRP